MTITLTSAKHTIFSQAELLPLTSVNSKNQLVFVNDALYSVDNVITVKNNDTTDEDKTISPNTFVLCRSVWNTDFIPTRSFKALCLIHIIPKLEFSVIEQHAAKGLDDLIRYAINTIPKNVLLNILKEYSYLLKNEEPSQSAIFSGQERPVPKD